MGEATDYPLSELGGSKVENFNCGIKNSGATPRSTQPIEASGAKTYWRRHQMVEVAVMTGNLCSSRRLVSGRRRVASCHFFLGVTVLPSFIGGDVNRISMVYHNADCLREIGVSYGIVRNIRGYWNFIRYRVF